MIIQRSLTYKMNNKAFLNFIYYSEKQTFVRRDVFQSNSSDKKD